MATFTNQQIIDHVKAKGWATADGKLNDKYAQDIYNEAKNFGVSGKQLEEAFGYGDGFIDQYTQSNGWDKLPAQTTGGTGTGTGGTGGTVTGTGATGITAKTPTPQGIVDQAKAAAAPPPAQPAAPPPAPPQIDYQAMIDAAVKAATAAAPKPTAAPQVERTTAPQATFTQYQVNPGQTNEGIISRLVGNTNTPFMQRAIAIAREQAADRGLLNSSIAANAGTSAAIDAAGEIASKDANIYSQQQLQNQRIENDIAVGNADRTFDSGKFNATEANKSSRDAWADEAARSREVLTTGLGMASDAAKSVLQKDMSQFNTDQELRKMAFDLSGDISKLSIEQKNYLDRLTTGLDIDLQKMAKDQEFDLEKLAKENGYDVDRMRRQLENDVALSRVRSELDTASQEKLLAARTAVESSITGKTTLVNVTSRYVQMVNDVRVDPDLSREEKEAAIADLRYDWEQETERITSLYGIKLPDDYNS